MDQVELVKTLIMENSEIEQEWVNRGESHEEGNMGLNHSNDFPFLVSLSQSNVSIGGSLLRNYSNCTSDYCAHEHLENEMPLELREISESSKICIVAYCVLFIVATSANLAVLNSVLRQYLRTKSRILLLLLHLVVADLIVCCTVIPIEVFWRLTIQWVGGNMLCKLCQFMRAFGLYLSSMVLICVSFDRFFAILFPMMMLKRRGHRIIKIMLSMAWVAAIAFAAPQVFLFSVATHPQFPAFKQCVTNELLKTTEDVRIYSIFSVLAMYFVPLVVILFTYIAILIRLMRKSKQNQNDTMTESQHNRAPIRRVRISMNASSSAHHCSPSKDILVSTSHAHRQGDNQRLVSHRQQQSVKGRKYQNGSPLHGDMYSEEGSISGSPNSSLKSNMTVCSNGLHVRANGQQRTHLILRRCDNAASNLSRAKHRTLVMTIVIVVMYAVCWTGHSIMTLWYMFDWDGATQVDSGIQDGLFIMVVFNSCVNPVIYGSFASSTCGLCKLFSRVRRTIKR